MFLIFSIGEQAERSKFSLFHVPPPKKIAHKATLWKQTFEHLTFLFCCINTQRDNVWKEHIRVFLYFGFILVFEMFFFAIDQYRLVHYSQIVTL